MATFFLEKHLISKLSLTRHTWPLIIFSCGTRQGINLLSRPEHFRGKASHNKRLDTALLVKTLLFEVEKKILRQIFAPTWSFLQCRRHFI